MKAGDIVKVKVMEVDVPRKRIGLSMRLNDDANDQASQGIKGESQKRSSAPQKTSFGDKNNAPLAPWWAP